MNPVDPTGPKILATIPHSLILHIYKYHPTQYENFRAAKFVLENPRRIFNGVRSMNRGGWCFTGRPETWNITEKETSTFPDDLVFAVYLNDRYFVYEFRAEVSDRQDVDCPNGWKDRYAGKTWISTS